MFLIFKSTDKKHTFEKQAPMWTFGVGGRPLEVALGGEVARFEDEVRSRRRGGACGEVRPFSLRDKYR